MARKTKAATGDDVPEGLGIDGAEEGMSARYEQNRIDAEAENAELEAGKAEEAKNTPLVALGTAEAIALGVANGESPTPGERPEGWEAVAEDVKETSETAGENAETEEEIRVATAEAEAEIRSAAAEDEDADEDPS